jgi:ADP-glucose pyrophosphorylase
MALRTYAAGASTKFVFAEDWRRANPSTRWYHQGCIISKIYSSILCPNVRVHSFCRIESRDLMPG